MEQMLTEFINKEGSVQACGTCLNARGLNQDDLVKGVEVGTMIKLAKWVTESSKVLTF